MLSVALGADHAGWELKEALKSWLLEGEYQVLDFGTHSPDSVDYPDYAQQVGLRPGASTRPGIGTPAAALARPADEPARAGRSRDCQGHSRRDGPPVAQPRADRVRELRLRGGAGSGGLGDDEQVRGRVSG